MTWFDEKVVISVGTVLGTVIAVLWKFNLLKFGRNPIRAAPAADPPEKCPDPACHAEVQNIAEKVELLEKNQNDVFFPKINRMAEDIAYIKGRIDVALRNNNR